MIWPFKRKPVAVTVAKERTYVLPNNDKIYFGLCCMLNDGLICAGLWQKYLRDNKWLRDKFNQEPVIDN